MGVERGHSGLPERRARARGPARSPRRSVLAHEGRWRLVDSEGRNRCRGCSRTGRAARVCRGARPERFDWSTPTARGDSAARGGKRVIAFAGEGHFDPAALTSNTFDIEWPPRSGRRQSFPEVDRAEWFDIELARTKMLSAQVEFLDRLLAISAESVGK